MIPLGKPKIDSLRIYLPLSQVTVNNEHSEFLRSLKTVNDDGEIIREHTKTTYFNPNEIVSCSYAVRSHFGGEDILFIGFSSKSLKELYFNGISKQTIKLCFDFINTEGLIKISKEAFLSASVVDVDFCIDYYLDTDVGTVKNLVSICMHLSKPNKQINAIPFKQSTNTGIQWGHRDKVGKSYVNKQFLKYYAKAIELTYNSSEFYKKYLKNPLSEAIIDRDGEVLGYNNRYFELDKLIRVETTIKNSKHFETYGYRVKTLKDLIQLDLDIDFLQIFTRPMSIYMTGYREIKHATEMTVGQRIKYHLCLYMAKSESKNIEDVVSIASHIIHPENIRSKRELKAELFNIIDMQEVGKKTHNHNTEIWHSFINEIQGKQLIP